AAASREEVTVVPARKLVPVERIVMGHVRKRLGGDPESPGVVFDLMAAPNHKLGHAPRGKLALQALDAELAWTPGQIPEAIDHDVRLPSPRDQRLEPGETQAACPTVGHDPPIMSPTS